MRGKVAVLGANGFVGTSIASTLERIGHQVIRLVKVPQSSGDVRCDVRNLEALGNLFEPDMCVVSALPSASPVAHEKSTYFDSPEFLLPLLRVAEEKQVRQFFYCSSGGALYGDQPDQMFAEGSAVRPISNYGLVKAEAERIIRGFGANNSIETVCWRFGNLYGPGQNPRASQGLVAVALDSLAREVPMRVFGDASRVRDYVHAADGAFAAAKMVGVRGLREVYNVGTGTGHSVDEVISVVEAVFGGSITRIRAADPPNQVQEVVLDNSLIQREFGPLRFRSLEVGVRDYVKFLRS